MYARFTLSGCLWATALVGTMYPMSCVRAQQAGKVHAWIAIDHNCEPRLPGQVANERNLRRLLELVNENGGGNRVLIENIASDEISPAGIQTSIAETVGVGRNDVLLFYYSGHGATDPQKGHFLATSGGNLRRSDLVHWMQIKNPRLIVLLTDCCSSMATYVPPWGFASKGDAARTMRSLLFDAGGEVNITAATYDEDTQQGEYGWFVNYRLPNGAIVPGGGVFTMSLCHVIEFTPFERLDVDRDGIVSWREIMPPLRQTMDSNYQSLKSGALANPNLSPATRAALLGQLTQRPQVFDGFIVPAGESPRSKSARPGEQGFGVKVIGVPEQGVVIQHIIRGARARVIELKVDGKDQKTTGTLAPRDLIQAVDDERVESEQEFYRLFEGIPAGETLTITGLEGASEWKRSFTAKVKFK